MYKALVEKDVSFEGIFYAGIKTTGIFCRPSCTARKPKPENVEYFETSKDAILNGYRACKVCNPLINVGSSPDFIKIIIAKINADPSTKIKDYDLVKLGIEPNRVRRWFKAQHGITFQSYQRMMRINNAYKQLADGNKVTEAAFENGYESISGFSTAYQNLFDEAPSKSKVTSIINITKLTTPIGPMYACANAEGICLLEFTDSRMLEFEFKELKRLLKAKIIYGENKHFENLNLQLQEYFEGKRKEFNLPLVTPGTAFQNQVWKSLLEIPYGKTISYKQQSIKLNNLKGIRAVAKANGCNRIAIVVPCHRVIGENGNLTGYAGGLWRKKWLLDFESKQGSLKFL